MADEEYVLVDDRSRTPVIREIPNEPSSFKRNITIAIWAIILVLLALFVGQNWRDETLEFLSWEFDIKLSFALMAAAFLGLVLGFFIAIFWKRR
jgi:uncharacterized integral membrane protein